MKRPSSFVLLASGLGLLLVLAIGAYAYDSSRDDLIDDGVSVGGVDVGGMRAEEARKALEEELAAPLRKPVRVTAGGERFVLPAKRAGVEIDVDEMVDAALDESREGNVLSRSLGGLVGGSDPVELSPRISYSERAVKGLVDRVARRVDRPAVDASVEPSGSGLQKVAARSGRELETAHLERAIATRLDQPEGERRVTAQTRVMKPDVTKKEVAEKYPTFITVDRDSYRLRYYRDLKLVDSYEIAVGRVGFETPAGLYHIQNKAVDVAWQVPEWGGRLAGQTIPGGAPNNPLKARWLGIYDGAGIHGTDDIGSLGTSASHGCIRMSIPEVKELYDKVPVDTPIYIS
jgi:lipoprotein-anchoring transpeptidase ErfK/SrfK